MKKYLNNAGAGILSNKTKEIILEHIELELNLGAYKAAENKKSEVEMFYKNASKLINADSYKEIAFIDNASRGWNLAINGLNLSKGDKIVTLSSEFGTNLISLYNKASECGASLEIINCEENGNFSLLDFENTLKDGAKFIAISHSVAHGSIINPVKQIGELSKKYNCTYIVDGCQAIGQLNIDVQELNCDAYITTGRKWLCGPRGTGFLYVKSDANIKHTQLDLASADLVLDNNSNIVGLNVLETAKRFELWEKNIANLLGLSNAIEELMERDNNKNLILNANRIRSKVLSNKKLVLMGKETSESLIIGFYTTKKDFESLVIDSFNKSDLDISAMHDWDCPLHFPKSGATKIFRISPYFYTDNTTIDLVCNILDEI